MSKDDFFNSLTNQQLEYCQFLIDAAYADGYDRALIENRI